MKRSIRNCRDCGQTEHIHLGFIPDAVISDTATDRWVNAAMCTYCGGITPIKPVEKQIARAEERYIGELVKENILSDREADKILG